MRGKGNALYNYLTRPVKKRILEALRACFRQDPKHRDVVRHLREKYDFVERPQKGIVLQAASATPMSSLAADNYMGTSYAYVAQARVDQYPGQFLEWVKEDDRALHHAQQNMPSPEGVYYVQVEKIPAPPQDPPAPDAYQFWVDPLLSVRREVLVDFATGQEGTAILAQAPLVPNTLKLYAAGQGMLLSGTALTLTAEKSLVLGGDPRHLALGLPVGLVPVVAEGQVPGPYVIVLGINDALSLRVNDKPVSFAIAPGTHTANYVAKAIVEALALAGVGMSEYTVMVKGNAVSIKATESLWFDDDAVSTANLTLGFSPGFVPATVTGVMVQPHVPNNAVFRAVVDGQAMVLPLLPGNQAVTTIADQIRSGVAAANATLAVATLDSGDYAVDWQTGEVRFLHPLDPGTTVVADYKYPGTSRGPFALGQGDVANNEAIPGVVLAFGRSLGDGDVAAVVVGRDRMDVADVYGGKAEMSLDIDVIARDAMTRSELADAVTLYLWQLQRERLAEEGLILTSVSLSGESEEAYDDTADDYFYMANISINLMTDWEIHVAYPLYIQRVTPTSFDYDARVASRQGDEEGSDLLHPVTVRELELLYAVDPKGNYERLR